MTTPLAVDTTQSTNTLTLRLLGPPTIQLGNQLLPTIRARKARALLYYLSMEEGDHTRAELVGLLWSELSEDRARNNLSTALTELRAVVGDYLTITPQSVGLHPEVATWLDVEALKQQLAQEDAPSDLGQLADTLNLYRGEFLQGFYVRNAYGFESWLLAQREQLRLLVLDGLQRLVGACIEQEEYAIGLTASRRLLALEPWLESAHRQTMWLLACSGQRSAALAQYETCCQVLEAELGVGPEAATMALFAQIRDGELDAGPDEFPWQQRSSQADGVEAPADSTKAISHNLPTPLMPLIGRKDELATIHQQLTKSRCRLLTILGAGGMGKTRLAIEAAYRLLNTEHGERPFAHGIYFVDLLPIIESAEAGSVMHRRHDTDPAADSPTANRAETLILTAIADALDLPCSNPSRIFEELIAYLRHKQILLILDNCEHLLPHLHFIPHLLEKVPGVQVMTTTRERLNLYGEQLLSLAGLSFRHKRSPSEASNPNENDKENEKVNSHVDNEAVALFIQSAQRVDPNFMRGGPDEADGTADGPTTGSAREHYGANSPNPAESEQAQIRQICRLVQGIPLAIEMAAGWLSMLDCTAIRQALETNTELLTSDRLGESARHSSMQAVFDYSWQMLRPEEQAVLQRLSIFQGSFSPAAAQRVGRTKMESLRTLFYKTWLYQADHKRLAMHELTRQYISERRRVDLDLDQAAQADHAAYFGRWLARSPVPRMACADNDLLQTMGLEKTNLHRAWRWALENQRSALIEELWAGLMFYHFYAGTAKQGEELFARGLAQLFPNGYVDNAEVTSIVPVSIISHISAPTNAEATDSVSRSRESLFGKLLLGKGYLLRAQYKFQEAKDLLAQSLSYLHPERDKWSVCTADLAAGDLSVRTGAQDHAKSLFLELAEDFRRLDDPVQECRAMIALGLIEANHKRHEGARALFKQALQLAKQSRALTLEAACYAYLSSVDFKERRLDQVMNHARQGIALMGNRKELLSEISHWYGLARAQLMAGQWSSAQHTIKEIAPIAKATDSPMGHFMLASLSAFLALNQAHYAAALRQAQLALDTAELITLPPGELCNLHFMLGRSHHQQQAWTQAKSAFQACQKLARDGGQATHGLTAMAGLADIALARHYDSAAMAHVEQILMLLPESELPISDVWDYQYVYLTCARVLAADGDERAGMVLTEARGHLQRQARAIDDEAVRRAFLENVPSHREIVDCWAEFGGR